MRIAHVNTRTERKETEGNENSDGGGDSGGDDEWLEARAHTQRHMREMQG